jgi:hypothetical protein
MKPLGAAVSSLLFLIATQVAIAVATPAFAAPQWVEDQCRAAAVRVRPVLRFDEVEAYVANCMPTGRPERHRPAAARVTTTTDNEWRFGSRSASMP